MRRALASGRPPRASGMILFFVTQSWKLRVCSNAPPREAFDVMVLDAPRFRDGLLSASCRGKSKSQRTVSTVEDVERPNHVRVELSRVAGAGRCHSAGLLSGAQLGWRRLISERALSYEDLSVSGPSAAAVHSGCAALSRTAADGRLCSRSKQFAPRPRSPGS